MKTAEKKGGLLAGACVKFVLGLAMVGLPVFLAAGTLDYWNGWLLMGVLFLPMLFGGLVLWAKAPGLLAKRLKAKEAQGEQRQVIAGSFLMFVLGFVLAGLDARFGWSRLPAGISWAAAAVFLLGYGLFAEVLRENAYLSRTVEVQQGQKVVDTGLYGVVRHPMYAATLLLFLSMPLILGSAWALVVFLAYPALLVKRIRNEEAVLRAGLAGYEEYMQKVRCRLIPYVW